MKNKLSKSQTMIISKLIDKYERSKSYRNENAVRQYFSIKPCEVLTDYDSDFADVDIVRHFEYEINELEKLHLITTKTSNGYIKAIYANDSNWDSLYQAIGRQPQRDIIATQLEILKSKSYVNEITELFVTDQIKRLETGCLMVLRK